MQQIDEKACPIVIGLDPVIQLIPSHIKRKALDKFGNGQKAVTECLYRFNAELIETLHAIVPAIKLQMACYELYGSDGVEVFQKTSQLAQKRGLLVIDDSKRNDIGSTAKLYAIGHLGNPPLIEGEKSVEQPDFLTINPLMGSDTIDPFVEECKINDKGIFVLVRTSNPSAKEYEEARSGSIYLFEQIALDIEKRARQYIGERGYSPLGAVVGATWPDEAEKLRALLPNGYFLVPGYGTQGGTADHVISAFDRNGYGALINSSRGIIFAYQDPRFGKQYQEGEQFAEASKIAVLLMKDSILKSLKNANQLPRHW